MKEMKDFFDYYCEQNKPVELEGEKDDGALFDIEENGAPEPKEKENNGGEDNGGEDKPKDDYVSAAQFQEAFESLKEQLFSLVNGKTNPDNPE